MLGSWAIHKVLEGPSRSGSICGENGWIFWVGTLLGLVGIVGRKLRKSVVYGAIGCLVDTDQCNGSVDHEANGLKGLFLCCALQCAMFHTLISYAVWIKSIVNRLGHGVDEWSTI